MHIVAKTWISTMTAMAEVKSQDLKEHGTLAELQISSMEFLTIYPLTLSPSAMYHIAVMLHLLLASHDR